MASIGTSSMVWFAVSESPKRKEAILVAVHLCGKIMSMPGTFDRFGKPKAIGCSEPVMAWGYYPRPSFNSRRLPNTPIRQQATDADLGGLAAYPGKES